MVHIMENIKSYFKNKIIYIALITSLLIIIIIGYFMYVKKEDSVSAEDPVKVEKKEEKVKTIKVDIKGEVNKPGVYEMEKGSRVIDAINKAGGLTDKANTEIINLSKKLEDEFVIVIYNDNDLKEVVMDKYVENNNNCPSTINDACIIKNDTTSINNKNVSTKKSSSTNTSQKTNTSNTTSSIVNLNTATLEELQTLSGIGESKALAIIEYREKNGEFKTVDELTNVSGIGESTVEKIKDNITV